MAGARGQATASRLAHPFSSSIDTCTAKSDMLWIDSSHALSIWSCIPFSRFQRWRPTSQMTVAKTPVIACHHTALAQILNSTLGPPPPRARARAPRARHEARRRAGTHLDPQQELAVPLICGDGPDDVARVGDQKCFAPFPGAARRQAVVRVQTSKRSQRLGRKNADRFTPCESAQLPRVQSRCKKARTYYLAPSCLRVPPPAS